MKVLRTENGLTVGAVATTSTRYGTFTGRVVDISTGFVDGHGRSSGRVMVTIETDNGKGLSNFAEYFSLEG